MGTGQLYIDDLFEGFLNQEKCQSLRKYLTREMNARADQKLVSHMIEVFDGKEEDAQNWFYTSLPALGNKRPYDSCKEGKSEDVETLLKRIEYGVHS